MPAPSELRLGVAESTADLGHVRDIFLEYGAAPDFDLCFQGFDAEIATLPGAYGPPRGRLFLARADGKLAGEIGYRRMRLDTIANMNAAQALYRSLGFMEIPPYYDNPLEGVVYFELRL